MKIDGRLIQENPSQETRTTRLGLREIQSQPHLETGPEPQKEDECLSPQPFTPHAHTDLSPCSKWAWSMAQVPRSLSTKGKEF